MERKRPTCVKEEIVDTNNFHSPLRVAADRRMHYGLSPSLHGGPLLPNFDLMGGQCLPQIIVHRRVVEGHRQHVEHGSDLATDDFDAGLGADDSQKSPVARIGAPLGAILGFNFENLGRLQ